MSALLRAKCGGRLPPMTASIADARREAQSRGTGDSNKEQRWQSIGTG